MGLPPHTTRSPASACKAWGTFGCTSTGPSQAGSRTISVKREGRQCYVILACEEVPAEPLPATGAVTGIDMGIAHFLTTAKGEHKVEPPARQAHRRCPRRRPARGEGVPPVHAGQPNRPASPCGGEGRHAASHGAPPAAGSRAQDRPGDSQRVRRDRARTVEHREHGPRATTQARPRQRGRVSPERSCSEGRG